MCPACFSAAAVFAAKVTAASGLAVYAVTKLRSKRKTNPSTRTTEPKFLLPNRSFQESRK